MEDLKLTLAELRKHSQPRVRTLAEEIVTELFVAQQIRTGQKDINQAPTKDSN